jgi:hypothetical protein
VLDLAKHGGAIGNDVIPQMFVEYDRAFSGV